MSKLRFEVALSFPGEHRARVAKIAEILAGKLGRKNVLYDQWIRAETARPGADVYLQKLYCDQSRLLVFFLCSEYIEKEWCGLEWRVGRYLIKKGHLDRLMLLRLDYADVPGLYDIDGYIDISEMPEAEVANEILFRLALLDPASAPDINNIVRDLRARSRAGMQARCGKIRILTMEQPIELGGIYTDVNLLEKRTSNLRMTREELVRGARPDAFDRFGILETAVRRVPGLQVFDEYRHVIIYGKPGAGKTTFLKRIAIECSAGRFRADMVPAFVTLKDFAEAEDTPKLPAYLQQQWGTASDAVLREGRALVLLDGLDEVRDHDFTRARKAIEAFVSEFPFCTIVVSCRIAAREYTFGNLTEVEMADFSREQIRIFASRWFALQKAPKKGVAFLEKLTANQPIFELASSPLLLTLLLLVFQERNDFGGTRADLYREGLDVLFRKWDAKRGIERDRPYGLTVSDMESLLGEIAYRRFLAADYFFDQAGLEKQIEGFFTERSLLKPGEELLAERVLNSIESHLGLLVQRAVRVYSFSHLTFQEYLTAHRVARKPTLMAEVGSHAGDPRWREVWLLLVTMVDADDVILQLKLQIDSMLDGEAWAQEYLAWCHRKADAHRGGYKQSAVREFYFARNLDLDLARNLDRSLNLDSDSVLDLDPLLDLDLDLTLARAAAHMRHLAPVLASDIEALREEMPALDRELLPSWRERLRAAAVRYRDIGHDWDFTGERREILTRYYLANRLLFDCIKAARGLTNRTRRFVEDTMLLPADKIPRSAPALH